MKKLCCLFLILLLSLFLNGCSDDDDSTSTTVSGAGEETTTTAVSAAEYSRKATYTSYGTRNGGRQAWRIPKNGPSFGKKIKVVFSNGHTVFVPNTSKNYRESDGFVFKPGIGKMCHSSSCTGTAHKGVYLHAPYGNRSRQATIYY